MMFELVCRQANGSEDRHGRKPVVIIGTALTGFFTLLFGLSKTFPTVLFTVFLSERVAEVFLCARIA